MNVSLRGPTYRENSHANHTWDSPSRQSACFRVPEPRPAWVRFLSPAPLLVVWRIPTLTIRVAVLTIRAQLLRRTPSHLQGRPVKPRASPEARCGASGKVRQHRLGLESEFECSSFASRTRRHALKFDEPGHDDVPRSGAPQWVSIAYQCGPLCSPVSSAARPAKVSDPLVHTGAQTVLSYVGRPGW
jgi:hypothetical protein